MTGPDTLPGLDNYLTPDDPEEEMTDEQREMSEEIAADRKADDDYYRDHP